MHVFDESDADLYQRLFDRLIVEQPEIKAVLVSTGDGFEIASRLPDSLSAAKLSAMTSSLLALSEAMSEESGSGGCRDLVIDATAGRILLMDIPQPAQKLVLTVMCNDKVTLGQVLWAVRACRDELSAQLGSL